jgi:hypothetical protein
MRPLSSRVFCRAVAPAVVFVAGCQDFEPPTAPGPQVGSPTRAPTRPVTVTTVGAPGPGKVGGPVTGSPTAIPNFSASGAPINPRAFTVMTKDGPFHGPMILDVKTGVPVLEAILANPIKAETEYRNRPVRLQGLGTIGKDDTGYIITFPTTAVGSGEMKPRPGIVARIPKGEEGPFAELKRDSTVTIQAVIRSWKRDMPEAFRGVVIEMDQARLVAVAHPGY